MNLRESKYAVKNVWFQQVVQHKLRTSNPLLGPVAIINFAPISILDAKGNNQEIVVVCFLVVVYDGLLAVPI